MNAPLALLILPLLNPIYAAPVADPEGRHARLKATSPLPLMQSPAFHPLEGSRSTIYEGIINSGPRNITMTGQDGTRFYYDGTNDNANLPQARSASTASTPPRKPTALPTTVALMANSTISTSRASLLFPLPSRGRNSGDNS